MFWYGSYSLTPGLNDFQPQPCPMTPHSMGSTAPASCRRTVNGCTVQLATGAHDLRHVFHAWIPNFVLQHLAASFRWCFLLSCRHSGDDARIARPHLQRDWGIQNDSDADGYQPNYKKSNNDEAWWQLTWQKKWTRMLILTHIDSKSWETDILPDPADFHPVPLLMPRYSKSHQARAPFVDGTRQTACSSRLTCPTLQDANVPRNRPRWKKNATLRMLYRSV